MPIYEYECKKCRIIQEFIMLPKDNKPKCPKCLQIMKKIISKSNFVLKGNCWAKDNYSRTSSDKK